MVIDEADIEAHGPFMLYRKEDTDYNRFKRWNEKIADDPVWEKAIVDRVKLMVGYRSWYDDHHHRAGGAGRRAQPAQRGGGGYPQELRA